jgi:hypothetical protein
MSAELMAYEHVSLGFEIVIKNADVEMGKIWNLWHNVKLTDDPESWDGEINLINKMQGRLGKLTVDQRLIRAQMAEFCRVCPLFPRSIDILCEEIGHDRFSKPAKMGCEGRDLLDSLGYHDRASLNEQQKEILSEYVRSLKKWLRQGQPETSTESKVFGFLGQPTDSKVALVEKLVHIADSNDLSVSSLMRLTEDMCKEKHKDLQILARASYLGRPLNCFKCLLNEGGIHKCQCCYSMLLDSGLLCAGTTSEIRLMLDEFRRFTEENVLAYSAAINSWLRGAPLRPVTMPKDAHFIKDNGLKITEKVHASLGEKDEVKEWLTACLLKTVKDNQRWHKTTELIDSFPEATSWLREKLSSL